MVAIKAKLDDKPVRDFLLRVERNVKDKPRILKGAYLTFGFKDIIKHFKDERGEDGPWERRRPNTDRRYDRISAGEIKPPRGFRAGSFSSRNKVLQLTGTMRQSIRKKTIRTRGRDRVAVISNVGYSGKHDQGLEGLPQRDFMWFSDRAHEQMAQFVIQASLKGA